MNDIVMLAIGTAIGLLAGVPAGFLIFWAIQRRYD